MAILSLNSVLNYGEITPNSRNLIEAERIIAGKLIITFRLTKKAERQLEIFALYLKTSGMKETPHSINLVWKKGGSEYDVSILHCSCKAGAGVCKNKTAVLLMCYR